VNERIKDLAHQAGFDAELMQLNHDRGNPSIAEKFAELIIQECIELVEKRPYVDDGNWPHPSMMIKKHFEFNLPRCSVCETTENVRWVGGYQPWLCDSRGCVPF
jgi:hypothetical protein